MAAKKQEELIDENATTSEEQGFQKEAALALIPLDGDMVASPQSEDTIPDAETVSEKKTRRRKKGESDSIQSDEITEAAPPEVNEDSVSEGATKRKRSYTRPDLKIISIDDRPTIETEADKAKNDLLDLIESQRTGRILSGILQGVERPSDRPGNTVAVLYHGAFKVILPATETVDPPEDYRGRNPDDVHHYMLTKRLGAEIDYIVKGIDPDAGVAVASRLEAMKAKRKNYYFGTDRDGNHLLYPGVCAEARVVSVIRAGIFIDLFGVET